MKKIYLLLAALCTLAFAGCNDEDDPTAPVLEIVKSDIGFDAAGGAGEITFKTSESAVKAVSDKTWLTISGTTATTVSYDVAESGEALQRSANITVTAGGMSRVITILQNGAIFQINSDPIAVDPKGETPSYIAYDTSMETKPTASVPADAKWLKATVEEGRIKLAADLNYTGARNTVVTIMQGWKPVEIPVTQDLVDLVDTKQIARDREAAEIVVTPTEYLAMAAASWDVETTDNWITPTKEGDKIKVSLTENTSGALRNGTVKIISGEGAELYSISVSQNVTSYKFFLGEWTMSYTDAESGAPVTVPVTFVENEAGKSYLMNGWYFDGVLVTYVEDGNPSYLSLTTQYMGVAGQYHIFVCPLFGPSVTWDDGIGMNFVYTDETTLTARDNGKNEEPIMGFQIAGFTQSGTYLGGFENYENISKLTR